MDYRRTRSSIRPPLYSNKLSNFLQTFHFCFPAYRRTVFNVSFTFDTSRQFLREFFGEEKKIFFEKFKILISKLKFLSFYTPTSFLFVALFERLKRLNTHTKKKGCKHFIETKREGGRKGEPCSALFISSVINHISQSFDKTAGSSFVLTRIQNYFTLFPHPLHSPRS